MECAFVTLVVWAETHPREGKLAPMSRLLCRPAMRFVLPVCLLISATVLTCALLVNRNVDGGEADANTPRKPAAPDRGNKSGDSSGVAPVVEKAGAVAP